MVRRMVSIEIVMDVQPDPAEASELMALADVNQLQQVLVNLALNARDALTKPTPITFRLRQACLAGELPAFPQNVAPGDYVVLEVEDPGSGMTPQVLSQALDPFFTTKEVGQGTGLGLPVAFGIVQGHQGFLTLTSEVARGTCVSIYLPRLTTANADERPEMEPGNGLEPDAVPGRNILVVDDEQAVLDVVRRFLEIAGHRVTCALNGSEALELLSNGPNVDLVILDLMIPREEGRATFQRLRQRRPNLPILLCTGLLQSEPAPDLLRHGAVGLLRKPFRMNELWYAVNQTLRSV
jgi:two-component system cell cycle sensor histidine kinase/response regulator CckA